MTEISYIKLNRFMHSHKMASKITVFLCRAITIAFYIFYPAFLAVLYFYNHPTLIKFILVPLISIILISVLRKVLNIARPYEKMDLAPLYNKKTSGCSFPSRHTFAVFIIAFSAYNVSIPLGATLLVLGFLLALARVLCGVHYLRDVLAGFAFAVISAFIGYILI